jgi:hypothetical protein
MELTAMAHLSISQILMVTLSNLRALPVTQRPNSNPIAGAVLLGLLVALTCPALAQETPHIGRPLWRSFDTRETGAPEKTYDGAFDQRGLIYAANDAGLLSYDGVRWRLMQTGNRETKIYALAPLENGSWLAGGPQLLGIFSPTLDGTFAWHDAELDKVAKTHLTDTVLAFIPSGLDIYAVTDREVLKWRDGTISSLFEGLPTGFGFPIDDGAIIAIEGGLVRITATGVTELSPPPGWADIEPIDVVNSEKSPLVLATRRSGLFSITLQDNRMSLTPLWDVLPPLLETAAISAALQRSDGSFVIGTEKGALYHLDANGKVLVVIDERSGFKAGRVRAITTKPDGNTFAFYDGGAVWLDLTNPQRIWDHINGLTEAVSEVTVDGATTFAATKAGLFKSLSGGRMRKVVEAGPEPITTLNLFRRSSMKGHTSLLLGRTDGLFDFFNNMLIEIGSESPSAVFISRTQPSRIVAGMNGLIVLFEFDRGEWRNVGTLGNNNYADPMSFAETGDGDLLVVFADGSVATFSADTWLSNNDLSVAQPTARQIFPRLPNDDINIQFAANGDDIHLFAFGPALIRDYRSGDFSIDTALATEIARYFGDVQPRWFASARKNDRLWLQTDHGSFVTSASAPSLIRLPDSTAATSAYHSIFIADNQDRALFATPDGIVSLPSVRSEQSVIDIGLPTLALRGITLDGKDIYAGEGMLKTVHIKSLNTYLTLTLSILDWANRCNDAEYALELDGLSEDSPPLPLGSTCTATIATALIDPVQSALEVRLIKQGTPVTTSSLIPLKISLPWYLGAAIPFGLGLIAAGAAFAGGMKSRRVWPDPIRRYLALFSALLISLTFAESLNAIPRPTSLVELGFLIGGLAIISLFAPIFAETIMRLSDRHRSSGI